jgi:hypothetical protein
MPSPVDSECGQMAFSANEKTPAFLVNKGIAGLHDGGTGGI